MTRSRLEACLLIRKRHERLDGLMVLLVDDRLGVGSPEFLKHGKEQ